MTDAFTPVSIGQSPLLIMARLGSHLQERETSGGGKTRPPTSPLPQDLHQGPVLYLALG